MGVSPRGQTSDKMSWAGAVQAPGDGVAAVSERRLVVEVAIMCAHNSPDQLHRYYKFSR